jgi:tetratricopeptide (TPR) repeat protein
MRALTLLVALWAPSLAAAASVADGRACLDRLDIECAEAIVEELGGVESSRADVLGLTARTRFHAARYPEAYAAMKAAVEAGYADPWDDLALYERTLAATEDWAEVVRGRYRVRYRPGVDVILLEDAFATLELADRHIAPLLGGPFPGTVTVELFPDGRSFIAASSLTEQDVRTTGVVALSKWSRLLLTSPRALGRGYGWQDTLAHEYLHMIVSHRSNDETPVWLQEAIAKYLDNRWKDGTDRFRLSVRQEGLLSDALAADTLVSFEDMHPSFAKLPTAELAALAYAQVSTLLAFVFERAGDDVLPTVLDEIAGGTDAQVALARAAGFNDFKALEEAWHTWALSLELDPNRQLAPVPVVLDGGDAVDSDPVLSSRADLARWVRIGDLLAEKGHPQAALVEYDKATVVDGPGSPLLANRRAQALLTLERPEEARQALAQSLLDYPEFALTHKTLGQILEQQGATADAVLAYREALALNPYDPEVQSAIAQLYRFEGREQDAALHEGYVRILRRGGEG